VGHSLGALQAQGEVGYGRGRAPPAAGPSAARAAATAPRELGNQFHTAQWWTSDSDGDRERARQTGGEGQAAHRRRE
jgi:hypothetical protein